MLRGRTMTWVQRFLRSWVVYYSPSREFISRCKLTFYVSQ